MNDAKAFEENFKNKMLDMRQQFKTVMNSLRSTDHQTFAAFANRRHLEKGGSDKAHERLEMQK